MSADEIAIVKSMEWLGEYYGPPPNNLERLADLGLLDRDFGFAATTLGEAVRYYLDKKSNFTAVFDPRDGDPHHIAAYDYDEPFTWPQIALVVALLAIVCGLTWWLS